MPMMIIGFFGFILAMAFWIFWAVLWLVVAMLFWLAWPLTLLVLACAAWRAQSRWGKDPQSHEKPRPASSRQSGNAAFEEYREETLRRLDEEREKFRDFLEGLRKTRDREAFDRFMGERRSRPSSGSQGAIA